VLEPTARNFYFASGVLLDELCVERIGFGGWTRWICGTQGSEMQQIAWRPWLLQVEPLQFERI
jgi:hypothetical protein